MCCGSKISLDVSTGNVIEPLYGSFAFRAREKNGQRRIGIVTAAHVISTGKYAYLGDNTIGVCTQSVLSGKIDAAFITISDVKNYEPSNYIAGDYNILSVSTSNPGIGTIVNKYGAKTKHTTGTIVSTNGKVQASNGNTLTNMTFANYESSGGDSGGIIYTYVSSKSTRYTVGIHRGNHKGYKVYSKASNVLSALNLERY